MEKKKDKEIIRGDYWLQQFQLKNKHKIALMKQSATV